MICSSLFCNQTDGEATSGSLGELQDILGRNHLLGDDVGLRIGLVVSVLGIGVDGAVVLAALVEEVQADGGLMAVLVALASDEPVVGALGLAGYGDVVGGLCLEIDALIPVAGYVADKLEGIVVLLVVLGQVGGHLQG